MLQLDYQDFILPFQYPFKIAKGTKSSQSTLVIFLAMGAQYGLGEATAISYYDNTIEGMKSHLEQYKSDIEKYAYNGPERFWHFLHHLIPNNNFLISALDIASWDMWSKLRGKSVQEMMGIEQGDEVQTDYTLGIDSPEATKAKIKAHPFPIYKLKVNDKEGKDLLEFVLNNTKATIRIDANEGWSQSDFDDILPLLKHPQLELIEQPFHRDDISSLIYAKSKIDKPIIADEAICNHHDWEKLGKYYDGLCVKLSKCGGLTPALPLIQQVKSDGKKIMLGSMSESNIGAAALTQLIPLADYADIDGPLLLKENIAKGLLIDNHGKISLNNPSGLGITWQ